MNDNREVEAQRKVSSLFERIPPALTALWKSMEWAVFPDSATKQAYEEEELIHLMWANANTKPLEMFCTALAEIAQTYEGVNIFPDLNSHYWASGHFLLIGRTRQALEFFPQQPIGSSSQRATEHLLSLKYAVGAHVSARDVLTLLGPQVTSFAKEHLDEVMRFIDILLQAEQRERGSSLVTDWARDSTTYWYNIGLGDLIDQEHSRSIKVQALIANAYCTRNPEAVRAFSFSQNKRVIASVRSMTREAENTVRQERGVPHVGEGWVEETRLYHSIKEALAPLDVQHHASPAWLGNQHLDIFIPELKVAIEYQGLQHYQPVEYFGGVEAFEKTQTRDARKARLCKRHGIHLIHVQQGYDLQSVLQEIRHIGG